MKCKNCGAVVNEYETVCPHCGELLKTANNQESQSGFLSQLRASQNGERPPRKPQTRPDVKSQGSPEQQPCTSLEENWLKRTFNFDNIGGKINEGYAVEFYCNNSHSFLSASSAFEY